MFEYEGEQYTLQDLQAEANNRGLNVNDFISKMKNVGMKEVSSNTTLDTVPPIYTPTTFTPKTATVASTDYDKAEAEKTMKQQLLLKKINTDLFSRLHNTPKFLVPYSTAVSGFITRNIGGIIGLGEGAIETAMGMTREEQEQDGVNFISKILFYK